jgi:uncharacterized phage-associated protein
MSNAIYTANSLIVRANNRKADISPLKLQKLVYLLYARYLYTTKERIFHNQFEAWKYGPVVVDLYEAFKKYGADSIPEPHADLSGEILYFRNAGDFGKCLDEVWNKFGWMSGSKLVKLTHTPGYAWDLASNGGHNLGVAINDDEIMQDGKRLFNG